MWKQGHISFPLWLLAPHISLSLPPLGWWQTNCCCLSSYWWSWPSWVQQFIWSSSGSRRERRASRGDNAAFQGHVLHLLPLELASTWLCGSYISEAKPRYLPPAGYTGQKKTKETSHCVFCWALHMASRGRIPRVGATDTFWWGQVWSVSLDWASELFTIHSVDAAALKCCVKRWRRTEFPPFPLTPAFHVTEPSPTQSSPAVSVLLLSPWSMPLNASI